jgi:type IV pilus assembly protein PilE
MAADPLRNLEKFMRSYQWGVTLIELMVVVVIISILAGIAYPSYREQVMRSKRADAKVSLQQNSQALENCFTRFHTYNDTTNCTVAVTLQAAGIPSPDGNYNTTAVIGDLTFTLTATPLLGQAQDTGCRNFILTETNARSVSGTKTAAECWK